MQAMLLPGAARPRLCPGPEHAQTLLWVSLWGPLGSGAPSNRTWSLKSASGWHLSGSCLPALGTTMDFRLTLGGRAAWQDSYSLCVPQDRDWSVAPRTGAPLLWLPQLQGWSLSSCLYAAWPSSGLRVLPSETAAGQRQGRVL